MKSLIHTFRSFKVICLVLSAMLLQSPAFAEGEAGIISLRNQGHFIVGIETTPAANGGVTVSNQMYVGYQLVAEPKHPYPLILVHGGGAQASDWFSTPDGRDGFRDYFLAAGFDVYWVDRPGYGRSSTNSSYGELSPSADSSLISFLATSDNWPGDSSDPKDPSVINWLAGGSAGPYAGDAVSGNDLSLLLDRIGPAIVVTHSAGGMTGWWGVNQNPDKVMGLMAIEAVGSYILENPARGGLTFEPPLAAEPVLVEDADGCKLQAADSVSVVPAFVGKPVILVGAEHGLIQPLPCALKALQQAGADASYIYLPDHGFPGGGHFFTGDTNNGEIAKFLIGVLGDIK